MAEPFHMRHKGPFQLQIQRTMKPYGRYHLGWSAECLAGSVDGLDVESECMALLTDPRDSIAAVAVWSIPESQHCITFR